MEPKKQYAQIASEKVIRNLERRGFEAMYADTGAEALELIKTMIPRGALISWGGTMTMEEIGLPDYLKNSAGENGFTLLDRKEGKTPEETRAILARVFLCDWYITGTSALTTGGILVNIDGNGNRLSALLQGPENVLVLAGINKLVPNEEAALRRIKSLAAPMNAMRLGKNTPCTKTASCADCLVDDCICSHTVYTRRSAPKGRIKVLIIGESLGY